MSDVGAVAFRDLLKRKKLKFTRERKRLLEEAVNEKAHFDADAWYLRLRQKGVEVSRDTVFRSIPLLLEAGVLQKSVGRGKGEYFENAGQTGHHDHMVCLQCGRVIEFASEKIERLQEQIAQSRGFHLKFHDHRLYGYCDKCR